MLRPTPIGRAGEVRLRDRAQGLGLTQLGRGLGHLETALLVHQARNDLPCFDPISLKHQDLLDYITNEDPKIKGEAEDKIRAALDEYAADFA